MSEIQIPSNPAHEIVGVSTWSVRVREQIRRAAVRNANVLILGPTGTGKDLIARAIHEQSNRAAGPLVIVDCAAATADNVAEQWSAGEASQRGTIFFDEVGDLNAACQSRLLRAIDQSVINMRIVASTNRNLAAEVAAGRFRADLYYRLRVITIEASPLHCRPEDIPVLASHFLREIAAGENEAPHTLTPAAEAKLLAHSWPGNVRELRNLIERAVAFADGSSIDAALFAELDATALMIQEYAAEADDRPMARQILPFIDGHDSAATSPGMSSLRAAAAQLEAAGTPAAPGYRMLTAAENERIQILTAMQMANYNQSHAATMLGITRQQLRRRIAKHFPDSMPAKRGRPRLPKAA